VVPESAEKRVENSLGSLTQRFVALVKHAEAGMLDLNVAAETLSVRKRRVYDITNVLEGIGLIEKTTKNVVQWKGTGFAREGDRERFEELNAKIAALDRAEEVVDAKIAKTKQELRGLGDDNLKSNFAFVTYADVTNLPDYRDQAVLAIRTPPNTRLEVPDPDEGMPAGQRRFQIHLKNNDGNPIYAFLLTNEKMSSCTDAAAPLHEEGNENENLSRQLFNHGPAGLLSPDEGENSNSPYYGLPALASFEGVLDTFGLE
jgi:transcription factor E2F3